MQTILITGINGFLGSNLATILSDYYNIIGLEQDKNNLFRVSHLDLIIYSTSHNTLESIFADNKIDIIIHAATVYGHNNEKSSNIIQTNILLPIKLLELARLNKVKAFLNIDSFFNHPDNKSKYLGEYSLSKKHCYEWLNEMNYELVVVNMRIFHMYGPGDSKNKFVTWIIEELVNNKPVIDLTFGEQVRDFIYIEDVASAFKAVLDNLDSFESTFMNIDIGSGKPLSIKEFVLTAKQSLNSTSELRFGTLPYRDGEIMYSLADTRCLISLNWRANITIETGIEKIKKSFS